MNGTKIEWVKNPDGTQGYTSNPVRGECPIGCTYCYVKSLRNRFSWHRDIRFYPQELEAIQRHKKPCGIFLGSTIELFHDKTIGYMPDIMETIKVCPQHRFYLLTKQPQNLIKFSPFPDNAWVGVTATNNATYLGDLLTVKAKVKYLSFEPLLRWDNLPGQRDKMPEIFQKLGINWLIIGAQTKPYKPPKIEWIREIVEAADKAGISVFLKDNLRFLLPYTEPFYRPVNNKVELRQEMPKGQNPLDINSTSVLQYCHKLTKGGGNHEDTGGCR